MNKKIISIIIPAYNEENNIFPLYNELDNIIKRNFKYDFEVIFINDGSSDSSWKKITDLANINKNVRGINFTRNFGQQTAITAGYEMASGDYVISMDCDLQDPPELIIKMLEKAEMGYDIVYARYIKNNESLFKKITSRLYYFIINKISDINMPKNVGDFRLISKKIVKIINRLPEKSRYIRGLVCWTGFEYAFIDFERPKRKKGCTNYTLNKMLTLAFDGLTGFSVFPLKIAKYFGIFSFLTAFIGLVTMIIIQIFNFHTYPIWVYLIVILFLFSSFQFIVLWLIGEYIERVLKEQKKRPAYLVKEYLNTKND